MHLLTRGCDFTAFLRLSVGGTPTAILPTAAPAARAAAATGGGSEAPSAETAAPSQTHPEESGSKVLATVAHGHHAPAFGVVCRALGIRERRATRAFMFLVARDVMSAATRCVVCCVSCVFGVPRVCVCVRACLCRVCAWCSFRLDLCSLTLMLFFVGSIASSADLLDGAVRPGARTE